MESCVVQADLVQPLAPWSFHHRRRDGQRITREQGADQSVHPATTIIRSRNPHSNNIYPPWTVLHKLLICSPNPRLRFRLCTTSLKIGPKMIPDQPKWRPKRFQNDPTTPKMRSGTAPLWSPNGSHYQKGSSKRAIVIDFGIRFGAQIDQKGI
jgi:hypothetical protein